MIFISVRIDRGVIGAEIDVSEVAVRAINEVERPPALIAAGDARYFESLDVGEENEIVLPDGRHTVARVIFLGKTVIFSAVDDSLSATDDVDVAISAVDRPTELGVVMLVYEHIGKAAVRHSQMAILQDEGEVRWQADLAVDLPLAADGGGAGSVFYRRAYCGRDIFVAVSVEFVHYKIPLSLVSLILGGALIPQSSA